MGSISQAEQDGAAPTPAYSAELERAVRRVLLRRRLSLGGTAALGTGRWLLLGLGVSALGLRFSDLSFLWLLVLAVPGAGAVLVHALRQAHRVSAMQAALVLDRASSAHGALAAAYEWGRMEAVSPAGAALEADSYKELLLGVVRTDALPVEQAAPVRVQGEPWVALAALVLLSVSAVLRSPESSTQPAAQAGESPETAPHWISRDDAELLAQQAEELREAVETDAGKQLAERFNEIVLQVAAGKLDQQSAFRLAAELAKSVEEQQALADALQEGLKQRGLHLQKKSSTESVGRALSEGRFRDAQEALRKLAERLQNPSEGLSEEEMRDLRESLEELRKELEEEAAKKAEAAAAQERGLRQTQQELQQKKDAGTASAQELQKLEQTERELKRLTREKKQEQSDKSQAQQTLSELDKQLAQAARELAEEQKKSGEFLDQAAQTVGQAAQRSLTDEEKRELLKQIEAMKERLRQQNKDGSQSERMRQFQNRARGQQQGQGEEGQGKQPGQGQPGQGQGPGKITLGPGGSPLPIPGEGDGQGAGQKPGSGNGEGQQGQGAGQQDQPGQGTGSEAGHGHDEQLAGDANRLPGAQANDTNAVGQDTGQGQSASETIATAAEEGFVAPSYEKLYVEYETVAEEVMEQEHIPPGKKAHVRRYFELIRPRDGAARTKD